MKLIQEMKETDLEPCHYLPEEQWGFRYFFAADLDEGELEELLSRGWRKFGFYYFRPQCGDCLKCLPIRVLAEEFAPSRNQRNILKKNRRTEVKFGPLNFSDRIFEIYENHSRNRFEKEPFLDDFILNFYQQSCPSLQSEYYIEGKLAAVGFLDRSSRGLSSVYFIFDTAYSSYSLGTFGALKEIELARTLGLPYYYLGYYIEKCRRMVYKGRFRPFETYDWQRGAWSR